MMNTRMNKSHLNIGVYILQPYARTEQHIKDLADCGIDFVVCMDNDRPALDLFSKYGVGAVVTGVFPGWWGGNVETIGKLAEINPIEKYTDAMEKFEDHPAIWGVDVGDEPSGADLEHYGKIIHTVDHGLPEQFAYLNLHPHYAPPKPYLCVPSYADYIKLYCEKVPTDYICYDFYPYDDNVPLSMDYENFRIVANACRDTGRSFWFVPQVNSRYEDRKMSENTLRFQAYAAMAFGAENIIWACYTAGWWFHNVLDKEGNKTEQYPLLQKINREIHTLAEKYMEFRRA